MTMLMRILFFMVMLLTICSKAYSEACDVLFPDGVSNAGGNNGEIEIYFNSRITNSPDNILDTTDLQDSSGGSSCDTTSCSSSNSVAPIEDYNTFPNSSTDISLGFQQSGTVSPGAYDDLILSSEAVLTMEPGVYTFRDDVTLGFDSEIIVSEPGTVFIYLRSDATINTQAVINQAGGDRNVLIYSRDDVFIESDALVNALIFARDDVELDNGAVVNGAISARDRIRLFSASTVNYDSTLVQSGDFEPFCSATAPPTPPSLVGEWRLDEASWAGVAGEALDSSGNDLHGNVVNSSGLPSTSFDDPVVAGTPGTCRYGEFNGRLDGYVEIPDPGLNSLLDLEELSVTVWINPSSWPSSGLATIVSKDENFEFHLDTSGRVFWWWGGGARELGTSATIPLNQWSHIAITYEEGEQHIYINGVSQAQSTASSGITLNNDSVFIGTDWNFHSRRFDGLIDEVRIYDGPLSSSEVQTAMNETHDCLGGAVLNRFQIDVGSTASVCAPQEVSITAIDSDENVMESYVGSIQLSTSSNNGTWSNTATASDAQGTLTPEAADSGAGTYVFEAGGADAGQITIELENTHAETLTITVNDTGEGVSSTSSSVTFSENAFVISENDSLAEDVSR